MSVFPTNDLISLGRLVGPATRLVVLPNVDTLYTLAHIDLRVQPLVLHVPDTGGRYYTMQLLDAYTNTFAYVGRRATGTHRGNYAIVGPRFHGRLPASVKRITSPTPDVWLLGRTLVDGPSDLPRVVQIERKYSLTPLSVFVSGHTTPPIVITGPLPQPKPKFSIPNDLRYFDLLGDALRSDPPPAGERGLLRLFASVGVGPGLHPSQEHLAATVRTALTAAITAGPRAIGAEVVREHNRSARSHNGWLVPPAGTGNAGSDFLLRAVIATVGLGANVPAEALYPIAMTDSFGRALSDNHDYVLHFRAGELPPVRAFWSVTMYATDLFLVPNPIDRYSVGDRTPGLRRSGDGSLDIYIAHSAPRGHESNWLPSPQGGFVLALRLYQPTAAVLRDRWPLPIIRRIR